MLNGTCQTVRVEKFHVIAWCENNNMDHNAARYFWLHRQHLIWHISEASTQTFNVRRFEINHFRREHKGPNWLIPATFDANQRLRCSTLCTIRHRANVNTSPRVHQRAFPIITLPLSLSLRHLKFCARHSHVQVSHTYGALGESGEGHPPSHPPTLPQQVWRLPL